MERKEQIPGIFAGGKKAGLKTVSGKAKTSGIVTSTWTGLEINRSETTKFLKKLYLQINYKPGVSDIFEFNHRSKTGRR